VPLYYLIKCPLCRNTFYRSVYRDPPKTVTCPYCGYRIDLSKHPQLILKAFEAPQLKR